MPRDVAEEAEPVAARPGGAGGSGRRQHHGVRQQADAGGVEAPVDEAVAQECARGDEEVDGFEECHEVRLPERVLRRALLGEAAPAPVRLRAAAAGTVARGEEQPFVRADQLVVVQRQDDPAPRGEPADRDRQLGSEAIQAVQMHDVRPDAFEHPSERCGPVGAIEPRHREAVVGSGLQDEVVAMRAQRTGRGVRLLQRGRGDEEPCRDPVARGERPRQVVRDDLGAAGGPVGMVVGDLKDSHAAHSHTSWPPVLNKGLRTRAIASAVTASAKASGATGAR